MQADRLHTLKRIIAVAGDHAKPEVNKNHLRLYGHNLCPFVARARYALAAKKVEFQEYFLDLNDKAPWHLDFNGGFVPILETPAGDLIKESDIIMHFANEQGGKDGLELVPSDPIEAAKMRVEMANFGKALDGAWPLVMKRGEDVEANENFKINTLPKWEALVSKVPEGKWLFGTDEPTWLDLHSAPIWEMFFMMITDPTKEDLNKLVDFKTNAPRWVAYMEKFQAHPLLHPYRFRTKAVNAHGLRSSTWPKDQKCQLSVEVLEGVFDDEE